MIRIHHAPLTRSIRVIWTCEELGLPYEVVPVDFSAEYRASAEWRRMNPVGKVPVMTDGDFVMFESCAMVQYLLDRYGGGRLQPTPGTPEHGLYLQWCWFGESTFSRPIGEVVNHRRAFGDHAIDAVMAEMSGRAAVCVDALDAVLAEREWLLGDTFSAADIINGYTALLVERVLDLELPASFERWWNAVKAREAWQATRAAEKAAAADAGRGKPA